MAGKFGVPCSSPGGMQGVELSIVSPEFVSRNFVSPEFHVPAISAVSNSAFSFGSKEACSGRGTCMSKRIKDCIRDG